MDEKSFKKLLDEAIVPVIRDLAEVKNTQAKLQVAVTGIKDTLDNRVIPSITETEMTVKSYADSYKENQRNIEKLDTRLTVTEDKLGIEPPEDLKVPHFAE
ncbi:MAG: hypothetical protein V1808_00700 [Candidatus Daviesbacteria bacterium]